MFITSEEEQISFHSENETDFLKPSLMELKPHGLDGSEFPDSMSPTSVYTDVNVVPEQEKNEHERSILNLEGEVAQLRQKERSLDAKRKEVLNKILDIKGSIRVFCRLRCFLSNEKRRIHEPISVCSEKVLVRSVACQKGFRFDKVFNQAATQEDVFAEVEPILRSALDGHNVCILAYGQTGTGKTFTMDGTNEYPGIIPRALEVLFHQASFSSSTSMSFSMSMLEVYMGNLRDLLAPKVACKAYETNGRCNLNIQTDPKGLIEIEGLTNVDIPDITKAKWWYNKGRRARSTSWTNVNDASSRSHCLMKITIYRHGDDLKAKTEVSKLWMVDLGGSERLLKTGATGLTMDEGRAINLSLSAFGDVIAALRRKRGHVPYRNSKLTQILKDSLGYDSKVLMLVHISPCDEDVGETICSLSFANRARAIDTSSNVPEDMNKKKQKLIGELEEDMKHAEEECQKVRHQIQKAELLLSENKRLLVTTDQIPKEEENAPQSPKEDGKDDNGTPLIRKETKKRKPCSSVPRFMTSTMASRQRQCAAEKEITGRAKSLRTTARSSVQFSCSQSFSYSDIRLKAILRNSNRSPLGVITKPLGPASPKCNSNPMTKPLLIDSPRCNDSGMKSFLPRSKVVTSSDPNLKIRLGHHRRRMSDAI